MSKLTPRRQLLIERISQLACEGPPGTLPAMRFFTNPTRRRQIVALAEAWVVKVLQVVRDAPDYDPERDGSTDDEIAERIMVKVELRRASGGSQSAAMTRRRLTREVEGDA